MSFVARVLTSFAVIMAFATASAGAPAESDEAALRHLKEVLWPKAYAEQDVTLLDSILGDEFRMIDADGNWSSKKDELDFIRGNKPAYDSLVFQVKRLDVFENGSAIVAGEGTVKGADKDGAYVSTYQSTNVLIKRDGKWRAIASHISGV